MLAKKQTHDSVAVLCCIVFMQTVNIFDLCYPIDVRSRDPDEDAGMRMFCGSMLQYLFGVSALVLGFAGRVTQFHSVVEETAEP